MEKTTFRDLNLSPLLLKALDQIGFTYPTEIQEKSIPVVMAGYDFIGQAKTGTGKTLSYAIPLIEKVDVSNPHVQALVLCPTRELSLQVYAEFIKLVRFSKQIRVVTIYGGQSIERQIKDLKDKPQIVIGTPGRIIDHMGRKTLDFSYLDHLVLDEADEMLNMGFEEDIEMILKEAKKERQTILFSATIPPFVKKVAAKYQNDPKIIKIESKTLTVEKIKQYYYECMKESKLDLLIRVLDYHNFNSVIVFANTKKMVDEIVIELQKEEYIVDGLHGDLKQMNRDRVMNSFKRGNLNILVATDVAARGIDVNNLEAIINFDLPQENELYVHRIGRTGRAGKDGISISFSTGRQKSKIREIEDFTKSKMEKLEIPTPKEIMKRRINKVVLELKEVMKEKKNNYNSIITNLISENYDALDIINGLFELSIKGKNKEYNEIKVERRRENKKELPQAKENKSSSYAYVKLNFGKNEGTRPQELLSFMEKVIRLPKSSVGDIKIRKSGTSFEIEPRQLRKVFDLEGKNYKGVRIKVKKVSSLN